MEIMFLNPRKAGDYFVEEMFKTKFAKAWLRMRDPIFS